MDFLHQPVHLDPGPSLSQPGREDGLGITRDMRVSKPSGQHYNSFAYYLRTIVTWQITLFGTFIFYLDVVRRSVVRTFYFSLELLTHSPTIENGGN